MSISVLRLGHRIFRDARITTHVFLVARALGAKEGFYTGEKDSSLEESVSRVAEQWGGKFRIRYVESRSRFLKEWKRKGCIAHLTVYGLPIEKVIPRIRKSGKPLLVVVGGEKVEPEVYQLADWNVSVSGQPHSEVAALALFLDRFYKGKELEKKFPKASLKVIPQERGKKVIKK